MTTANRHHSSLTGLELTVPIDTDSVVEGLLPHLTTSDTLDGASADTDEPTDVSGEAKTAHEAAQAEAATETDEVEAADEADEAEAAEAPAARVGRFSWKRFVAYGPLPGLVLLLAVGAGYLKWQDGSARLSQAAAAKSVQVATESTIAILSYRPDTADKDLPAAANRLTGSFRGDYMKLINDVVIPGAKQKKISAQATVPAAGSVSATENHAVVLVFVNQTIIVGDDPPTNSASSVRVSLDKTGDKWLISRFDPV
jgi:Mce-associated membrane protein